MKIADVRVRSVRSSIYRPFTNSLGRALHGEWEASIVEVVADDGTVGAFGTDIGGRSRGMVTDMILNQLKPLVVGEDPMNYERVWRKMFGGDGGWRPPFTKGEIVRAISLVDTAIWDLMGKSLDTPVYKLLGGYRDEVPCYASGGHYISLDSHSQEMGYIETEMARYMEMGFKAVKMRVGRDLAQDVDRARLVREVIGPDAKLMMDFNTSASFRGGARHAIKFIKALEEFGPYWVEDPLVMDDIAGMKQIVDSVDTAIATGEAEQTIWGFRDLVLNRAADILLPDATEVCGGITEWRRIAVLADTFHIPVAAHIGEAAHVHCIAAVPNGLIVEVFTPHDKNRRAYEKDPVWKPNERGMLEVPQKPGLGIELDEDYISKNLID